MILKPNAGFFRYFRPAECLLLVIILVTLIADLVLIQLWGAKVIFYDYIGQIGFTCLMLSLSFLYRWLNRSEAIGATTMCTGLFMVFTAVMALLNYLFLPNTRTGLDHWLVTIDASLGYTWVDAVTWSVNHPWLNEIMRFAYMSNLYQIVVLIILLGLSGRIHALHGMMMSLTFGATIAVLFWIMFPSVGPSALFPLPEHITALSQQVVGTSYGAELTQLLTIGPDEIRPNDARGLISFPSYHTVMALAGIWYSRSLKWLFPLFVLLNLAVLPAILVHGGHHLVDIPAGALVFIVCAWISERFLRAFDPQQNTDQSRFQSPATKNFQEPSGLMPIR